MSCKIREFASKVFDICSLVEDQKVFYYIIMLIIN